MPQHFEKTFDFASTDNSFREYLEAAPVGVLLFQDDFLVKYVNKNFFMFNGVVEGNSENLIGKSIYKYRLFEDVDLRKELNELEKGTSFEKELVTSRTLGGGKISILVKCSPIILNDVFKGGVMVIEDVKVSPEKHDVTLLHSSNFQNFLYLICDYFFLTDSEGNIKLVPSKNIDEFEFLFESDNHKVSKRPQKFSAMLFKNLFDTVIKTNKTVYTEIPFVKNSQQQKVVITLIPFGEHDANIDTIIVLVRKITGAEEPDRIPEEELKELNKYQQIVSRVLDGVIGLTNEGRINFWNESATKLFGLTRSEVFGKFIGKIFPQIDKELYDKIIKELSPSEVWEDQLRIGEEEGIAEYYDVKIGIIGEAQDESIIMLCANITHRIKTEKELRKSEELFKNIVTNSHEFICILSLSGKITYANPQFLDVFMYAGDEIHKLYFNDLIDPYYLSNTGFSLDLFQTGKIQSLEIPMVTKLGQRVHVLAGFSLVSDIQNIPQYYSVILTDITLKKESEKDLLLIRSVFEASLDGIALLSKKKFVLVNDSFVKMFGYTSASEILSEDPLDLIHEKDLERIVGYIDNCEEGKNSQERYEFTGRRRDNTILELENSVSTYQTEDENFTVWVLRNITEEKKIQKALQISEERYRSISENINQCIWTAERVNGDLQVVFYSPALKKITGYSGSDFLIDTELWQKIIHPDDIDEFNKKMDKLYGDITKSFDTFEYRIIDTQGNVISIENKITLARGMRGEIEKVFGIISDVSIAKRAEEELKKSAKDLKELNDAKDRFISIVSHDLRTPFTSILGFTDFLLTEKDLEEDKRDEYISFIRESAKSMLNMVNSLLDWTRLQTGRIKFEPDRINSKVIVDKVIQVLSGAALQKNISIVSELDKDFFIHADESLLFQVFNNLISNAIKFTKQNGTIRIIAKADVEKRQAQFSVKDDGVGIMPEDKQKLFKVDSKYTTPGTAGERGSGLGLSLVNEIVQKHGGQIWVESEYGHGSEFIFTIPVASNYILLVEDMNMDRLLYSKLLRSLMPGYTVLEAENGRVALEQIKQYSPALVITDHNMPEMNGYELVKQLNTTELKYKPPVIILSIDITPELEKDYDELGVVFVFQKPVNLGSFKNAIEKSLRRAVYI
jgi:PAS domain S-box-containing protein